MFKEAWWFLGHFLIWQGYFSSQSEVPNSQKQAQTQRHSGFAFQPRRQSHNVFARNFSTWFCISPHFVILFACSHYLEHCAFQCTTFSRQIVEVDPIYISKKFSDNDVRGLRVGLCHCTLAITESATEWEDLKLSNHSPSATIVICHSPAMIHHLS